MTVMITVCCRVFLLCVQPFLLYINEERLLIKDTHKKETIFNVDTLRTNDTWGLT